MKIYSMTATFGKLEHQTLTLTPGLNIVEAPNEWGKSTWCAFLVNMLYGIDTRERTTATSLADKERYAPWSGAPMAGSIDLNWNGRDITIQRRSRGQIPFGTFQAFETATGIEIPELTGANCGQTLLGVERSVFVRAGFLKLNQMPVTQDDALRRRLNALVTTGDESGAGDNLAQKLKDLKNQCRHNRTGLLPQAENERDMLRNQLDELQALETQGQNIRARQETLDVHIAALSNHLDALHYAASKEDAQRVEAADREAEAARAHCDALAERCRTLPPQEEAQQQLNAARNLQEELLSLQMEQNMLPPLPQQPQIPLFCQGGRPEDAVAIAEADLRENQALEKKKRAGSRLILGYSIAVAALLLIMAVLTFGLQLRLAPGLYVYGGAAVLLGGITVLTVCALRTKKLSHSILAIYDRYPGVPPTQWLEVAQTFAREWEAYLALSANARQLQEDLEQRTQALRTRMVQLPGGETLTDCQNHWSGVLSAWQALADAQRDLRRAAAHAQDLRHMVRTPEPPKHPDILTFTEAETTAQLENARNEQRTLQLKLGQCQGQAESLGQPGVLKARLETLQRRIARLEDTYAALEIAQEAVRQATTTLQRRFAPRISKRAQEMFSTLTGGRYQRITLGQDLTLSACAEEEDTLRSSQWRSDGTVDQLYLALRLAVAEELTPEAPLVLDDALVRFDDQRLQEALALLKQQAEKKQVILFTCQTRENKLLSN